MGGEVHRILSISFFSRHSGIHLGPQGSQHALFTNAVDLRAKREVVALAYGGWRVRAEQESEWRLEDDMEWSDIAWHPANVCSS